jgi:hypothetical protein
VTSTVTKFLNLCQDGQMHQYAWERCWKILSWNKYTRSKILKT